mmetsp:Transcript_29325/g.69152  ORF Transcript_29325/g.69152 Transcript_29325/m.69152 type:complete len:147 (+) Transcript_29325:222-662(+)
MALPHSQEARTRCRCCSKLELSHKSRGGISTGSQASCQPIRLGRECNCKALPCRTLRHKHVRDFIKVLQCKMSPFLGRGCHDQAWHVAQSPGHQAVLYRVCTQAFPWTAITCCRQFKLLKECRCHIHQVTLQLRWTQNFENLGSKV